MVIRRKVDGAGRVVLPKDLRNWLDIKFWDELTASIEDGKIIMQKDEQECKITEIKRKMDDLGRIVLPRKLLNQLGIAIKDELAIYVDGGRVIFQKCAPIEV